MIGISVIGANGRVGKFVTRAIEADDECQVVSDVHSAQVLIDFSTPKATLEYAQTAAHLKIPMVIGTTGFSESEKTIIHHIARKIPIVFSPNMSVGINISYQLLALATKILKRDADIGILDIHRRHKKDAPSGTALKMGETIQAITEAPENIQYSSLRLGENICDHSVLFCWEDEQLEITHRAASRSSFAKGALKAAKWILNQKPGLYDMQHVLGFNPL